MTKNTVIITGASGGIGQATINTYIQLGYTVAGIDEQPALTKHENYHHYITDITNPEKLTTTITLITETLPTIKHVIAIAGGAHPEEIIHNNNLENTPPSVINDTVTLNLTAQIYLTQAVLPHLRKTLNSTLTFTSSINATRGISIPAYSAAKAGLISLAQTLASIEKANGPRFNTVLPGTVKTPRTIREQQNNPDYFETVKATTTLNRTTTPEEIAATFVAITENLTAMTGQTVTIDAGQTAKW